MNASADLSNPSAAEPNNDPKKEPNNQLMDGSIDGFSARRSENPSLEIPDKLEHQWVLAGIASASARFIPLPLVDDIVRERSRQFAVARTLASLESPLRSREFSPLYGGGGGGWIRRGFRKLAKLPLKLILFPVRKLVRLFGSIRGVPLDLMQTILIGRTVYRLIESGRITHRVDHPERTRLIESAAEAFTESFAGIDWRAVKTLMRDTMLQVEHWGKATTHAATEVFNRDPEDAEQLDADELERQQTVASGAEQVETMLSRPETLRLIDNFDRRFDEAFSRLSAA